MQESGRVKRYKFLLGQHGKGAAICTQLWQSLRGGVQVPDSTALVKRGTLPNKCDSSKAASCMSCERLLLATQFIFTMQSQNFTEFNFLRSASNLGLSGKGGGRNVEKERMWFNYESPV
jgi:hypothetical protein